MIYKHLSRSPAALVAACIFTLPACKDGESDTGATATEGTGSATDGATDTTPTSGDPTGNPTGNPTGDPTGDPSGDPSGDPTSESDSDTSSEDGPHALGTIFLGESHPSAGGVTSPAVSAFFIPDVDGGGAGKACTKTVAGCEIAQIPDCGGCNNDEYCGFDGGCNATCQPICDASCAADEVCYFPSPGNSACKKNESFDAGALTFLGTPIPITLFPPYGFMSDDNASPFAPGGSAKVQASGASGAGFEKFEKEFTGTDFIATSPKLDSLGFGDVFGSGPLPIKWTPGTGKITISASVTTPDFKSGSVTCKADDASGKFDFPREALKAAVDGDDISGLTLTIQRQRTDIFKDLTTKGELTGVTVQPVGHLHIITSSSEYHTFQGCNPGEAVCNEECVDVQYDNDNCGACNKKCSGEDECQEGTCNGIDACNACAADSETGTCKAENDACNADPACKSFETCFTGCQDQQCQSDCVEGVPQDVLEKYDAQIYCICDEACVGECAGLCG